MIKLIILFLLFFPFYLISENENINTQIVSVRVYQGAANITRAGSYIPKGNSGFRIKNLGDNIIDSSVSIRFEPENAGIKIKRINLIPQIEKTFKDEEIKKLTEREESLSRKIKVFTEELEAINKQRSFISTLTPQKKDPIRDSGNEILMNTKVWSGYQNMLTDILNENSAAEWKLLKQLDETREEHLVVESKLDYFSKSSSVLHKDLEVEVTSNYAQSVKVFVDYMIKDAHWYPRYEVKVDTKTKTNQISFFALVRNNTGEDWKNVSLAFSAADLSQKLDLPLVNEWRISYYETPVQDSVQSDGFFRKQDKSRIAAQDEDRLIKREETKLMKPMVSNSPLGRADEKPGNNIKEEMNDFDSEAAESIIDGKKKISKSKKKLDYYGKAKQFLSQGNINSRSNETESNLIEFKNVFENQQTYFSKKDYSNAIQSGKKAMERLSLISPKYQSELSSARQEIEDTVRKSALIQANSKITTGLIPPLESSGGYDYRYTAIAKKETLLSDNSFNRVLVSREILPTNLSYETAPIEIKSVFLTSNSVARNKEPLLKGPLDIYVKEDYVATSVLQNTATGEDLKFDLGSEKDVEVERKEDSFREKKGFFSGTNSITTTITTRLKNRKKEKISILVVDRIPYTNDSDTKIETKNLPEGNELSRSGILKYKLIIPAGETKEIKYEYKVLYPEDSRLKEKQREGEK